MDNEILRRNRKRKEQQLKRRRRLKLCIFASGFILAAVLLGRGLLRPVWTRFFGSGTDDSTTLQTDVARTDPDAAVRRPLKGKDDIEKLSVNTIGWHEDSKGRWFQNADGTYFADGFQSIDGIQYYFDDDGHIVVSDWVVRGGVEYYFDANGSYIPGQERPMIALTFDDGPSEYTDRLLDALEANGAHATFFMLGWIAEEQAGCIRRMLEIGCEIGNHSWNHVNLPQQTIETAIQQIRDTDAELEAICGQESTVVRPPYGSYSDEVIAAIDKPFILWCVDSLDWSLKDAKLDYDSIMNSGAIQDGSIILMHDIYEPSVACAEMLIPALISQGYRLVTISEMARAKNVDLISSAYTDFWDTSLEAGLVPGYRGEDAITPQTLDVRTDGTTDDSQTEETEDEIAA